MNLRRNGDRRPIHSRATLIDDANNTGLAIDPPERERPKSEPVRFAGKGAALFAEPLVAVLTLSRPILTSG